MKLLMGGRCLHHQRGEECPDDWPLPIGPMCKDCTHDSCRMIRGDRYRCPEKVAWIEDARDEQHPLYVLGTWEAVWRDHLGQPTDLAVTLPRLVDYLDRQMHVMAATQDVPFEDFARDLRACRGHLEDVLRDGEQIETGAPCPQCGRALVKSYGETVAEDKWECPGRDCKAWYTDHDYRARVTDDYRANADRLTAPDIQAQYRVPTGTVRGWATIRPGEAQARVRKRGKDDSGRQLYDVADVLRMRDGHADRESA